jgi:hypothetical protein
MVTPLEPIFPLLLLADYWHELLADIAPAGDERGMQPDAPERRAGVFVRCHEDNPETFPLSPDRGKEIVFR